MTNKPKKRTRKGTNAAPQISPEKLATPEEINALINRVEPLIAAETLRRTRIPGYNRIWIMQAYIDTVDLKKSTIEKIHAWISAELARIRDSIDDAERGSGATSKPPLNP